MGLPDPAPRRLALLLLGLLASALPGVPASPPGPYGLLYPQGRGRAQSPAAQLPRASSLQTLPLLSLLPAAWAAPSSSPGRRQGQRSWWPLAPPAAGLLASWDRWAPGAPRLDPRFPAAGVPLGRVDVRQDFISQILEENVDIRLPPGYRWPALHTRSRTRSRPRKVRPPGWGVGRGRHGNDLLMDAARNTLDKLELLARGSRRRDGRRRRKNRNHHNRRPTKSRKVRRPPQDGVIGPDSIVKVLGGRNLEPSHVQITMTVPSALLQPLLPSLPLVKRQRAGDTASTSPPPGQGVEVVSVEVTESGPSNSTVVLTLRDHDQPEGRDGLWDQGEEGDEEREDEEEEDTLEEGGEEDEGEDDADDVPTQEEMAGSLLQDLAVVLSRSKRSRRRGYRQRMRYGINARIRAQMLAHRLSISYQHVQPCSYKDRYYCMNGGTCVFVGALDIKTCR